MHDPYVLGRMAARHVDQALAELRTGYQTASVDLKAHLPPHVIADVLQVYRAEGARLTAAAAAIPVVTRALRASHPSR
ncbi:hypothetical protein FH608_042065 [Nonomuraea phyllanthi]|uniref:Uncharacterized protein n=1 Tax=Nonomuraea phyllanthi TaxID=2219224 RepID=A0A5C4VHC4_9ACTN|nr:hypothetical protein [Nonomuraea phyllanthi]KAB8189048.1 hypothetical protein FH608_042065 [Nonomuraea phyllanthi]